MTHRDVLLERLDAIGQTIAQTDDALVLLGLGSVGQELERLDDYSDLDFFVIAKPGKKARFIEQLDWLENTYLYTFNFKIRRMDIKSCLTTVSTPNSRSSN